MNKTARSIYSKYMIEIMKAESKRHDECIYLLAGGTLITNTVQTKRISVSSTALNHFLKNDNEKSEKSISQNEYTWINILRRCKGRPSNLDHLDEYKFVAFHFNKDQGIHPQFFGYNKVVNFHPTVNYLKIMLTISKPWNNSIEDIFDNPKDTLSSHFISCMHDEDFDKPILIDLLRVKISMRYVNTEETNFGIFNENYSNNEP